MDRETRQRVEETERDSEQKRDTCREKDTLLFLFSHVDKLNVNVDPFNGRILSMTRPWVRLRHLKSHCSEASVSCCVGRPIHIRKSCASIL